ncbi:hypothetical protein BH11ACT7_BH11ACT7_03770 [soil metagenome]
MLLGRFTQEDTFTQEDNASTAARLGVVLDPQSVLDVTGVLADFAPAADMMTALIAAGDPGLDAVRARVTRSTVADVHDMAQLRWLAPLEPCRMRNFSVYDGHIRNAFRAAIELRAGRLAGRIFAASNLFPPRRWYERPSYYKGNHLSVIGPCDNIVAPPYTDQLDYELELAVIIGKAGANIAAADADQHVFGYTLLNDVSARDVMARELLSGMGPAKSKDFDTGNVLGPWIATRDDIADPRALQGWVAVNGERRSQCSTSDMCHGIGAMLAEASRSETLMPGELFGTGCCTGGSGIEQKFFLRIGDIVEMTLGPFGTQQNRVVG